MASRLERPELGEQNRSPRKSGGAGIRGSKAFILERRASPERDSWSPGASWANGGTSWTSVTSPGPACHCHTPGESGHQGSPLEVCRSSRHVKHREAPRQTPLSARCSPSLSEHVSTSGCTGGPWTQVRTPCSEVTETLMPSFDPVNTFLCPRRELRAQKGW